MVSEAEPDQEAKAEPDAPVIAREQMRAEPMTVSDAIMQINLLHQDFFVFLNDDNGQLCVLYRREGGEYGLIEAGVVQPQS